MKLLKNTIALFTASLGAAMLAGPAVAVPLPIASQDYNGTINFSLSDGLSVIGDLDAYYRTPPGSPRPYQFNTSLAFGELRITPVLTVTTPKFVLVPAGETCLPFIGCFPTPEIALPSQNIPLTPTISLTNPVTAYDLSYTTTTDLPLGQIFAFDVGTPLQGVAMTVNDLVRAQFETGATTVSETGLIVGPLTVSYDYEGELQPNGNTILADYRVDVTGPGLLGEFEAALLDIINDNTGLLSELAYEALLAANPCGNLTVGQEICNAALNGLDSSALLITVDSIGNFSSDFTLKRSIVPVPVPATLPLLALGVALIGLVSSRRRKLGAA
ncbi:MAG: PEP-CTERM sorting domain-containing protein [Halioglobus sp.]|nr:PEP-CTERM sorting domain-containing protein [Halioglobus sp.]